MLQYKCKNYTKAKRKMKIKKINKMNEERRMM